VSSWSLAKIYVILLLPLRNEFMGYKFAQLIT